MPALYRAFKVRSKFVLIFALITFILHKAAINFAAFDYYKFYALFCDKLFDG